jgi:hypothetical protein
MRGAFGVAGWGRGVRLASLGAPVPECESVLCPCLRPGGHLEKKSLTSFQVPHAG